MRSGDFWNRIVNNHFMDDDWLDNFRMTKSTFDYIYCTQLFSELTPNPLAFRPSLSVEKKVAIVIFKLSSCSEYRVVGNLFGVHKSTVHTCVYQVCKAINKLLRPLHITMPTLDEAKFISQCIKKKTGMEQLIGAIDGTHIPVLPPKIGYRDFVNRKGWPSMVLQGYVDNNYIFRNITIKYPGSVHDATVLKDSNLYQNNETLIPKHCININGKEIPLMIAGDPAYPLLPWLLKGYTGSLTPEQESFNTYHSSARICVENAFGRLKGRLRCLLKRCDINYKFMPQVISACCVLHNIVEQFKDNYHASWTMEVNEGNICYAQPSQRELSQDTINTNSKEIREILKEHMAMNYPLRKSSFKR